MRRILLLAFALVLGWQVPAHADTLSITAWSTGDALNATNLNSRHTTIQNLINGNLADDNIKAAAAIAGSKLDLTSGTGRIINSGGTATTSTPVLSSSQTWNAGAVTFTGWKLNITDTSSASGSLLLDLQVGGSSKFSVDKSGNLVAASVGPHAIGGGDERRYTVRFERYICVCGHKCDRSGHPI